MFPERPLLGSFNNALQTFTNMLNFVSFSELRKGCRFVQNIESRIYWLYAPCYCFYP